WDGDGGTVGPVDDVTDQIVADAGTIRHLTAVSEDGAAELLFVDLDDGDVFRLVPEPTASALALAAVGAAAAARPARRRRRGGGGGVGGGGRGDGREGTGGGRGGRRAGLAGAAAAIATALASPPVAVPGLGLVMLAPLVYALDSLDARRAFFATWLYSLSFALLSVEWLVYALVFEYRVSALPAGSFALLVVGGLATVPAAAGACYAALAPRL